MLLDITIFDKIIEICGIICMISGTIGLLILLIIAIKNIIKDENRRT